MANGAAKPESTGTANPFGVLRLETYNKQCMPPRFRGVAEHRSSIPVWERGYGLNYLGIEVRYN